MKTKTIFLISISVILIMSFIVGGLRAVTFNSVTNTEAPVGSVWIEGKNLHWANGTIEYWTPQEEENVTIAEAGLVTGLADNSTKTASFSSSFLEIPYVFATTQTTNGAQDPSLAHVWSIDSAGFTTQHCEYDGGDICDSSHTAEDNGWVAIRPSTIRRFKGMDAGTVSTSSNATVFYNKKFENIPLVFVHVQTKNGVQDPRTSRPGNINTNGFTIEFCEQETADGCDSHNAETIAWWAIDPNVADKGNAFDWGTVNQSNSDWNTVNFSQDYDSLPVLIVEVQTLDGSDALYEEANNVGTSGGDIRFCESDGGDTCDTHGERTLAWLSVSQGVIERRISYGSAIYSMDSGSGQVLVDGSEENLEDVEGINKGYRAGNLNFHINQWAGSSNLGEIDITCPGGDTNCEFATSEKIYNGSDVLDINSGIATNGQDKGIRYIMYSNESVHIRFSANPPHASNADHFIAVHRENGSWQYDSNNNSADFIFTPRDSDILIAEFNGNAIDDSGSEGSITYVSSYSVGNDGVLGGFLTSESTDPIWTTGKYGNALEFEGDYILINSTQLRGVHNNGEVSYSMWYNYKGKNGTLFHRGTSSGYTFPGCQYEPYIHSNHVKLSGCSSTGILAEFSSSSGWNHLVVSLSDVSDTARVFLNGELISAKSITNVRASSDKPSLIFNASLDWAYIGGANNKGEVIVPFNGTIDEFQIYSRALSFQEVKQIYLGVGSNVGGSEGSWWIENKSMHWIDEDGYERAFSPSAVSSWNFDEGSGITATDLLSGNDGTIYGANWTIGKYDYALDFDGVDDYVNITSNLGNLSGMTLSLWFKKPNINEGAEYLMDGRNGGNWWFLQDYTSGDCIDTEGNICFDAKVEITSADLSNNEWYHVAVTETSNESKIYLNGELKDTGSGEDPEIGSDMVIGTRYTTSAFFNGTIDEVQFYDEALSEQEIKQIYQGTGSKIGGGSSPGNTWMGDGMIHYIDAEGYKNSLF